MRDGAGGDRAQRPRRLGDARRESRPAAAGRRRRPPRPDPARPAQPGLARRRDGAVLERPPLRLPHRLRRLGGAPVPRLRDRARPLGARPARRRGAGRGGRSGRRRAAAGEAPPAGPADLEEALRHYRVSAEGGLLKILSKMGISLLASYHGAQLFEAVGLGADLIELAFAGTPSRIGGLSVEELAQETVWIHQQAFPELTAEKLQDYGFVRYRPRGEYHLNNPEAAKTLRRACVEGLPDLYRSYSEKQAQRPPTVLRDLLRLVGDGPDAGPAGLPAAASVDDVEPADGHPPALLHRRHVARRALAGGARDHRRRHGAHPRPRELRGGRGGRRARRRHRRRRRRRPLGAVPAPAGARERRPGRLPDPPGRLRALRRHHGLPRRRRAARDQGRPGRQAGRGRRAARRQGHRVHRRAAPRRPRHHAHLAAAAPRHLLDRGPRRAHLRPAHGQPAGRHLGQAGRRHRHRHHRRRRGQGRRRRDPRLRPRRRHRRRLAQLDQARRHPLGARPRRGAPHAGDGRVPRVRPPACGRRPAHRPRRRRGGRSGRRRVRLRHGGAARRRLRDGAGLPPEQVPGRRGHAGPRAAQEVRRPARAHRQLLRLHRRGGPRAAGRPRPALAGRAGRAGRRARARGDGGAQDRRPRPLLVRGAGGRAGEGRAAAAGPGARRRPRLRAAGLARPPVRHARRPAARRSRGGGRDRRPRPRHAAGDAW